MSDSLNLTKFVGLLKAGVSLEQSIEHIGGADQSSKGLRYLLQVSLRSLHEIETCRESKSLMLAPSQLLA